MNGVLLGRYTAAGDERLVGRAPTFEFRRAHVGEFPAFGGDALLTMFAPNVKTADAMSADGLGATYCLDISDVARGVDGNALTIRNTLAQAPNIGTGKLRLEVGDMNTSTVIFTRKDWLSYNRRLRSRDCSTVSELVV